MNAILNNPKLKRKLIVKWNDCQNQDLEFEYIIIQLMETAELDYNTILKFVTNYIRTPKERKY